VDKALLVQKLERMCLQDELPLSCSLESYPENWRFHTYTVTACNSQGLRPSVQRQPLYCCIETL
jgi:hypothetical protein